MGAAAALNAVAAVKDLPFPQWPGETAVGSLLEHLRDTQPRPFQPMNANLGIFPPLDERVKKKSERCEAYARRSARAMASFLEQIPPLVENIQTKQLSSEN
jgi:methylenetetrahydrofolate--tRNA-(uracil-5-)-methyltransferase